MVSLGLSFMFQDGGPDFGQQELEDSPWDSTSGFLQVALAAGGRGGVGQPASSMPPSFQ